MKPQPLKTSDCEGSSKLAAIRDLIGGTARGMVRLPVLSGSMAPTILPGDILLVRPLSGRLVHAGDVAVFLKDGKVTSHRIVFICRFGSRAFLMEMGDANRLAASLQQNAILGMVDSLERGGERVPFIGGAENKESRRDARRLAFGMFWRYFTGVLPIELLKKAVGK